IALLPAEVHAAAGDAPEPQAVGPADLVEFEVPLIAGVALGTRPYQARRLGVAHQREQIVGPAFRGCDAIRDVRRALTRDRNGIDVGVPECLTSAHQVRIDEEIAIPGGGEVLVRPGAIGLRPCAGWSPRSAGAIGALGQPAAGRRAAEEPLVF